MHYIDDGWGHGYEEKAALSGGEVATEGKSVVRTLQALLLLT